MLNITKLEKSFGSKNIFNDVNLTAKEGEIIGIVGPNGCGKSILFKIICGFMKPTSGIVKYNENVIGKDIDFIPSLGVLIENSGFIGDYTHYQNLKYLSLINKKVDDDAINKVIERVGLNLEDKIKVKKYSLGMKQKLGIAQAIMENPKVLIIDEPFNGLDKTTVAKVKRILLDLKSEGVIILLTSHISGDVETLTDRIYEFDNHTLVELK